MDELEARIRLLIADRNYLAGVVSRERREFTEDEIAKLATLNGAIDSALNALRAFRPETAPRPQPPSNSSVTDDYRLVASRYYEANREDYRFAAQLFAEYGRWLVVTIAGSHIGGIFFLGGLDLPIHQVEPSLWTLTVGLILILFCGLAAYWNFMALAGLHASRDNILMLTNPEYFPPKDDPSFDRRIRNTYTAALVLGLSSAICILLAAVLLSWNT